MQCNIDRVKTVGSVIQAGRVARNLTQQLASCVPKILPHQIFTDSDSFSSDPAGSALMSTVNGGLIEAEDGIADIVGAIFNNEKAPADARDRVGDGLTVAFDAASNITS